MFEEINFRIFLRNFSDGLLLSRFWRVNQQCSVQMCIMFHGRMKHEATGQTPTLSLPSLTCLTNGLIASLQDFILILTVNFFKVKGKWVRSIFVIFYFISAINATSARNINAIFWNNTAQKRRQSLQYFQSLTETSWKVKGNYFSS